MKRFRETIISVIVLVILIGIAYLVNLRQKKLKEIEIKTKKIFLVDEKTKNSVDFLSLKYDKNKAEYEKKEDTWIYKENPLIDIDSSKINRLIDDVFDLSYDSKLGRVGEDKLREFELDGSKRIDIASKDKRFSLVLGARSPIEDRIYVMDGNGIVYLINQELLNRIREPLKNFRKKDIIDIKVKDVAQIDIKNPKGIFTIKRFKDRWVMLNHPAWDIGDDEVEGFIRDMDTLFVRDFVSDDKNRDLIKYGLNRPMAVVSILTKDNRRLVLFMNVVDDKVYVASNIKPTIYLLDRIDKEKFLREPLFFRNRDILPFMSWDVVSINFKYKDKEFGIKKDSQDKWFATVEIPEDKKINPTKVDDLLALLDKLKVERFIDYPNNFLLGFNDPKLVLTVEGDVYKGEKLENKERKKVVILFGKEENNGVYVKVQGRNEAYFVKEDLLKKFPKSIDELLENKKGKKNEEGK